MFQKKVLPGEPGHLDYAKKAEMIKFFISLALVIAIFLIGFITTGSRKNWFTLIAVLGCLPMARYAVNWIARLPYSSINKTFASEVIDRSGSLPVIFDFVFTNKEKNHPVECIAISDNTLCGFSSNPKTDLQKAEEYLAKDLHEQGFKKITVKIFKDKNVFLDRIAEMAEHYSCTDEKQSSKEERIASTLFSISL